MARKFSLEYLETRDTPAAFGLGWVDPQHITLSFAPDGTSVSGASSNLFSHLQADGLSSATVQSEVLRAINTWTSQANLNVSVVGDNGTAVGANGLAQGDSRFGDIRISMRALSTDALAITSPPGLNEGTLAGDIILNSNYDFSVGNQSGRYDLYSTLLHEAGHAFGLDHSTNANSPMYESYQGVRTGLDASDVTHIQAIYGAPTSTAATILTSSAPSYTQDGGTNETIATATNLQGTAGVTSLQHYIQFAKLGSASDVDVYKINAASQTSNLIATISSVDGVTPAVTFYDANGTALVATDISTSTATSVYQVEGVPSGSAVYVRVSAGLSATSGTSNPTTSPPPGTGPTSPNTTPPPMSSSSSYRLTVDFFVKKVDMPVVVSDTLSATNPAVYSSVTINSTQVIAFNLLSHTLGTGSATTLQISVYNNNTHTLVANWTATPGVDAAQTLLLSPGEYEIKISGSFPAGSASVGYDLRWFTLTDPIGVPLINPATQPGGTQAPPPPDWFWQRFDNAYYSWMFNLQ